MLTARDAELSAIEADLMGWVDREPFAEAVHGWPATGDRPTGRPEHPAHLRKRQEGHPGTCKVRGTVLRSTDLPVSIREHQRGGTPIVSGLEFGSRRPSSRSGWPGEVSPMPVSSIERERCQQFLQPGEEIRYVFPATSAVLPVGPAVAPFYVVITDRSIVVLTARFLRRARPDGVWARYPRSTRLGPLDTSLGPSFVLGDVIYEVDEEYAAVVGAADAELDGEAALPEDPLPDL